jgi:hypothetical protein
MTAETARPGAAPIAYEDGRHNGLLIYAAVLLGILGFANLLDGIAALAKSSVFIGGARYVFGDQRAWGVVVLALGAIQILAAAGVATRNQLARWFGVASLGLNVLAQMVFLPSYPFWSLLIVAIDVAGLWALCAYGGQGARLAAYRQCN